MAKEKRRKTKRRSPAEKSSNKAVEAGSFSWNVLWRMGPLIALGVATNYHHLKNYLLQYYQGRTREDLPCRFVMAESTVPEGGFGIFALEAISPNEPLPFQDPVIQLVNLQMKHHDGISFLLHSYCWRSSTTGGANEGVVVNSVIPGMNMLANAHPQLYNVLWKPPTVHHGGLDRQTIGAGSSTHYHNVSHYAHKRIRAGGEVLVNYGSAYGSAWEGRLQENYATSRSVDWLIDHGICLDHIRAGLSPGRGRGAFATRFLKRGSTIAPVPLIPIDRSSLDMDDVPNPHQMLLNYCYGHKNSSVLLFPYAPIVNLINHDMEPNAELRWSNKMTNKQQWLEMSAAQVKESRRSGLLLEVVALRDLEPDEEIFISYGDDWTRAWESHVASFENRRAKFEDEKTDYTYTFEMNQKNDRLRTLDEQQDDPYPSNVQTSCFYMYAHATKSPSFRRDKVVDGQQTTRAPWNYPSNKFQSHYLRPCHVLERDEAGNRYTVEMLNWQEEHDRIPAGERHFVTHVPRHAIVFTDKLYTTDQHLPYAFRHDIGLPTGVFPDRWVDLL